MKYLMGMKIKGKSIYFAISFATTITAILVFFAVQLNGIGADLKLF